MWAQGISMRNAPYLFRASRWPFEQRRHGATALPTDSEAHPGVGNRNAAYRGDVGSPARLVFEVGGQARSGKRQSSPQCWLGPEAAR